VVDQVLVAEPDAEHPLANQGAQVVDHAPRIAPIAEASREAMDQLDRPVGRPQQERAGIRGDGPAIEIGDHGTAVDACKHH
jgi:hypothetical protein